MQWMRKFVRVGAFQSVKDKRLLRHLCAVGIVLAMVGSPLRARAAHSIFGATPMPDWARTAARQTLPSFPGAPKAVVLLEEQTYTVAADGVAVEHVRRVVKILRPQGRDYGYQAVWYDKDSKILSMHVWSIDPAGHEYTANDNDFLEVSPPGEGGELYEDIKARVVDPPGRDPGGVVVLEYEKRMRPYIDEADWSFQDELPRMQQSYTLILPAGYSYSTAWAHHASVAPTVQAGDKGTQQLTWQMDGMAAIDLEHVLLPPAQDALTARMTVHYAAPGSTLPVKDSWQGVGEWYSHLAQGRLVATPELTAKAQELTAGKTDFYDKAEAIGDFVQQQVRYFVIEMGVGGFQPHFAGDVFRDRYGDCKDKAALLVTMLSAVNLHGAMVMVDTDRGVVDPAAPSIIGNHMVAAIQIPQGYENPKLHSVVTTKTGRRYLIFDPTWTETPFGSIEDNLQGGYGVLVEGDASQAIELPVLDPQLNSIHRTAHLQLLPDGTLKGSVTDQRLGDIASYRRMKLKSEDERARQRYLDEVVAEDLNAATLSDLKFENLDRNTQALKTSFQLSVDHFAMTTGSLVMIRPRVLGEDAPNIDHKPRKVAVDLSGTMQIVDDYDIDLPPGYAVDELPDPVKLDVGFASYTSSSVMHGNTLHYSRTYTQKKVELGADQYEALQRLASAIAADEDGRAVLKKQSQ